MPTVDQNGLTKKSNFMNDLKVPLVACLFGIMATFLTGQIGGVFQTKDDVTAIKRDVADIKLQMANYAPKTDVVPITEKSSTLEKRVLDTEARLRSLEDDNRDQKPQIASLQSQQSGMIGRLDSFLNEYRQGREDQRLANQEINFKLSTLVNGSSVRLSTDPPNLSPTTKGGQ